MDGTIIDSEHIWKKATKDLISTRGVEFHIDLEKEINDQLHGLGLEKSCTFLKERFNLDDAVHVLVKETSHRAVSLYREEIKFIDGFVDFHAQVKKLALKNGVATNADDATVEITNAKLNLRHYFDKHIYAISQVNNVCKPNPAIYLHAAEQLNIDPRECIAIEDSAHGIKAAKSAGMFCIGINSSRIREQVQESDLIINHYSEIDLPKLLIKK